MKYFLKIGELFEDVKSKMDKHLERLSKGIGSIEEVIVAQQQYTDYLGHRSKKK